MCHLQAIAGLCRELSKMGEPANMGPRGAAADAELSISACVATPSRVVITFEGEPDVAAAQDEANYKVVKALGTSRTYRSGPSEYDPEARVTVLRNPVIDVTLADWLRVTVAGLQPDGSTLTHFARVQSDLPLSHPMNSRDRRAGATQTPCGSDLLGGDWSSRPR
jgi:hypothetical protein